MSVSQKTTQENGEEAKTGELENARKRAQRLILLEHLCNTLADRMWLYAAGLLLIDTIAKLDENSSSIVTASLYGVVLASVKILFAPLIGSLIESSRRLRGAMTSLIFQNTTKLLREATLKSRGGATRQKNLNFHEILMCTETPFSPLKFAPWSFYADNNRWWKRKRGGTNCRKAATRWCRRCSAIELDMWIANCNLGFLSKTRSKNAFHRGEKRL